MPSDSSIDHGQIAAMFVVLCTAIGFWLFMQTDNVRMLTTWFWAGIGLAGIYLLTTIANTLDELDAGY